MVVIKRALKKVVWAGWMTRYWVMDKYHTQTRFAALVVSVLLAVGTMLSMHAGWLESKLAGAHVQRAFVWWVQLVIMVVAYLVAYAMRPKVEGAQPQEGTIPTVQDGKSIIRIYGTEWIDDSIVLAWDTSIPPSPIRKKGSKK